MYKEILNNLHEELNLLNKEKCELIDRIKKKEKAYETIAELQAEQHKNEGKLAVQKGICPFPEECSLNKSCVKDRCNADTCSNGYAYRFS